MLPGIFDKEISVYVCFYMMNWNKWFIFDQSKSACCECTNEKRANKSWGMRNGDGIYIAPSAATVGECFIDDRIDCFNVATCCYLWNYTTVASVDINL